MTTWRHSQVGVVEDADVAPALLLPADDTRAHSVSAAAPKPSVVRERRRSSTWS
jgi:hypothetical protein